MSSIAWVSHCIVPLDQSGNILICLTHHIYPTLSHPIMYTNVGGTEWEHPILYHPHACIVYCYSATISDIVCHHISELTKVRKV